jgi:pimeloyl-ACP methyl ester carboxylesterase
LGHNAASTITGSTGRQALLVPGSEHAPAAANQERMIITDSHAHKTILLILIGLLLNACVLQDLSEDIDTARDNYGYLKGQVAGSDTGADTLVMLMRDEGGEFPAQNIRTVRRGESFYAYVPSADYSLVAFEDINGDFVYQPGEPAGRVDDPDINWFSEVSGEDRIDPQGLRVQQISLATSTVLDGEYDLSLARANQLTRGARNFLRVVTWEDENFSAENIQMGLWQPAAFEEDIGYGLYVLEEFDPGKKSILLVHGISDSPRVFRELAAAIGNDYQLLMFHYPSAFPLEYTSYALSEVLDELVKRGAVPQLDVLAHSMGGLVSKGMIYQASPEVRQRLRLFISIASPFGGHAAASHGIKWAPVIAPVWWAMAPGSTYLQKADTLDLSNGPLHHLIYTYAHEAGGEREEDDTVVSVESQLIESARANAVATYGMADNHKGVMSNACTLALVPRILEDGRKQVEVPDC